MPNLDENNKLLRALPSVDAVLKTEAAQRLATEIGPAKLTALARRASEDLRHELLTRPAGGKNQPNGNQNTRAELLRQAEARLLQLHEAQLAGGVRRVINGTGVILHTNLGRAPLSAAARAASEHASGYCTLEYDTISGARGRRAARAEELLADLTEAESALIVNNCAAAALLVLNTFSREAETIVSRGELVEIGGDFRVPDVMAQSGARMVEVGTTNRTRLSDYREAINENTRVIMRVHTSNYRIVGFTKTPSLADLVELSHAAGLLLYEDAGSGALSDLQQFGIEGEPVISQSIRSGCDLVTFSGDKLLGGPQAGLIVGRAKLIDRLRHNPLYRALRADKLRLAALEATLAAYARGEFPQVLQMIAMPAENLEQRAQTLLAKLLQHTPETLKLEVIQSESAVGGGSAPTSSLPTYALGVSSELSAPNQVAATLRQWDPPIITRIVSDRVLIDLRTVAEDEESEVEKALCALAASFATAENPENR
ncbi:MAG TPA: L-seryl-tRNA(Sec) selenium transferase [Pyrinomonadaceae bacterium]|nr:L-seryl-tRNA(Sec) selenium transferase [Pyrinomonadaceae bacterium]